MEGADAMGPWPWLPTATTRARRAWLGSGTEAQPEPHTPLLFSCFSSFPSRITRLVVCSKQNGSSRSLNRSPRCCWYRMQPHRPLVQSLVENGIVCAPSPSKRTVWCVLACLHQPPAKRIRFRKLTPAPSVPYFWMNFCPASSTDNYDTPPRYINRSAHALVPCRSLQGTGENTRRASCSFPGTTPTATPS